MYFHSLDFPTECNTYAVVLTSNERAAFFFALVSLIYVLDSETYEREKALILL